MNQRLDLYRNVHKGIRVMLADLMREAGRADFTDPTELENLKNQAREVFELLESHAHTEDRFMMPLLAVHHPALGNKFAAAHGEQEALLPSLLAGLELIDAAAPDAEERGHTFVLRFSRLAGDLLMHMADEELEINTALWKSMSDEELGQVERELVSSIPPDRMGKFLRYMLPAMNRFERVTFLGHLPPPVFDFVRALAREVLSPDANARLEQDLGVVA